MCAVKVPLYSLPVQQLSLVTTTLHKIDPVVPDNQGFKPRQGQKHFLFTKKSTEGIGSTQIHMEKVPRNLSQGESGLSMKLFPYTM